MTVEHVQTILGWCFVLNYSVLVLWFLFFQFAADAIFHLHLKWFALSREQFDLANYYLMGAYKLVIIVFILVPYIVLKLFL